MGQMGFFDLGNRLEPPAFEDATGWFRGKTCAPVLRTVAACGQGASRAGRKPWDAIVMFKTMCALYNLSDDQVGISRDAFVHAISGVGSTGFPTPCGCTANVNAAIEALFDDGYLGLAMGGQIIDASIVAVPKQRNSREENARIKAGETSGMGGQAGKAAPKGCRARWTKKHGKSHYGYKNHERDRRPDGARYHVSDAAELRRYPGRLWVCGRTALTGGDRGVTEGEVVAEPDRKGRRNKPLSEREKQGNKTRSSVRVRVEHVFGAQSNDMGGTLVRSVGLVRAKARIGLKNLAYNMRRLVQLERLAAAV